MATEIIIRQLLVFGILIAIGALGVKRKIISSEMKNNLAKIILDISLPFLIFTTFTSLDYDPTLIRNGLLLFGLTFVNLFFLYLVGSLTSRLLKLAHPQKVVHSLHTMLGNSAFLGFPLLDALFPGGLGIFYAAIFHLATTSVTFTFGIYKLSDGAQKGGWKSLANLNSAAMVLGVVALVFSIKIPTIIAIPFEILGNTTSPLAMVYIGAMLASIQIRGILFRKSILVLSVTKLVLIPMILAVLLMALMHIMGFSISKTVFFVLMLQTAMPCQTIMVVLSHKYEADYMLAGVNLFATTLLSIFSLPLVYWFLERVWIYFEVL